jgi:hypothetical protein
MDCGKIREMLAAFHDGELAPEDRARVEEHLRGCAGCAALLERLARIDAGVGVPEPGPEYWERFNRRVMERLDRAEGTEGGERAAAPAGVTRPVRGRAWRRLPYFLPAAAAAALLFAVVRQAGVDPFHGTARETAAPTAAQESLPVTGQVIPPSSGTPPREGAPPAAPGARRESPAAPETSPPAVRKTPARTHAPAARQDLPAGASPDEASRVEKVQLSAPAPPSAAVPHGARDAEPPSPPSAASPASLPSPPAGPTSAPSAASPAVPAAAPGAGSPAPPPAPRSAKNAAPEEGILRGMYEARPADGGAGEKERVAPGADAAPGAVPKAPSAAAPAAVPPPCEEARSLAGRGRLAEAEAAQRACLSRKISPEARESGMVFLAELLDRQSRFAEADAVIEETRRRFPASRVLDAYLGERPGVRGRRFPAAR